jgi:hypothetical protein
MVVGWGIKYVYLISPEGSPDAGFDSCGNQILHPTRHKPKVTQARAKQPTKKKLPKGDELAKNCSQLGKAENEDPN